MKNKSSDRTPPRLASYLLKKTSKKRDFDFVVGDLMETYESIAEESGVGKAKLWFWIEVMRAVPGFGKNALYWSSAMLRNYIKIAVRNIYRNKMFATINILGLSVGMACFFLIALWVRDELSFDKFHVNKDRLYQMTIKHPNDVLDPNVPYALAPVLKSEYSEITDYTRLVRLANIMTCSLRYQDDRGKQVKFYEDKICRVDPGFFSMFSFSFLKGDPDKALKDPDSVILSEGIAEKYFGSENPLGKKLTFNDDEDWTVTAVVRIPANSHIQFDFWAPLKDRMEENWNWADPSYILLEKSASVENFKEKIAGSLNRLFPHPLPSDRFVVDILPIDEVYLSFGRRIYVYIFSIIAILILFIACINYMNLSTATSSSRAKEVGLRKVVGAKKFQLIHQFLGESTLMTVLAFLLSLIMVKIFLPLLNSLTAKQLTIQLHQNMFIYLIVFVFLLVVGLLSGSYPALILSSYRPVDSLRISLHSKTRRSKFRLITVIGQFSISVLLIVCTFVVYKQLNYVQKRPLGFQTEYVIKVPINTSVQGRIASYRNELLRNPNIVHVTASQAIPYDGDYKTGGVEWDLKDPDFSPLFRYTLAYRDYTETFGMEIVDGRSFSEDFATDQYNYVINEEAARYMNMDNPVGQRLKFWGQEGQIIGVVKNFHQVSLHRAIMPQIITINPHFSHSWKYTFLKIASENMPGTIDYIRKATARMAPNFPFAYSFLDQEIGNLYQTEKKLGLIFGYFALLAMFISCLGILGLSAFTAGQKTKEIGIRKILGSSAGGIVLFLSKEFSKWILLANVVAWPLAWYIMNRWLENFAYRIGLGLDVFVLAGLLSLMIAAIPVGYYALKAALSDPVNALRYE
ncbi:MAG: ABC transporter permease [Candidatus Aminicenantes bacterium]|nr:ABC transporter permease [Candidatus Aminicenantes bacterium]